MLNITSKVETFGINSAQTPQTQVERCGASEGRACGLLSELLYRSYSAANFIARRPFCNLNCEYCKY